MRNAVLSVALALAMMPAVAQEQKKPPEPLVLKAGDKLRTARSDYAAACIDRRQISNEKLRRQGR